MNKFQNAYFVLGLEPGASRETVQRRYKRLILVWHPDRFPPEQKDDAEEELKKINNARDVLWKHFDSPDHKAVGCECQIPIGAQDNKSQRGPDPEPQPKPHPGPGPGPKRKTTSEQDAERRDAERKARAAQEEAARQAAQQTQRQAYDEATKQQKTLDQESLRWKIALVEGLVFAGLSLFGWIGGGIALTIKNATSTINNETTNVVKKKDDPCSLQGQYQSPPARIEDNLTSGIKERVSNWIVKCDGTGGGAIVEGRDSSSRLMVIQFYLGDWSIDHQDVLLTNGNEITVDRYRKPSDYVGRCVYKYDSAGHFQEVAKLDSQQNTEITATVERNKTGRFYSLTVKPTGGNTSTYYDTDGTSAKEPFYLSGMLMNIDKYVEPSTALTGTFQPSDPSAGTANPFKIVPTPNPFSSPDTGIGPNRPNPFERNQETPPDIVRPANPFTTTTEPQHLSPSPFRSPSATPETDKLLEKLKSNQ